MYVDCRPYVSACFFVPHAWQETSIEATSVSCSFGFQSTWLCQLSSSGYGSPSRCLTRLQRIKIQLQGLHYSSHHYPHGTHFSNFIGFLSNCGYCLSWLPLPAKSKYYTPVLRHYLSDRFHPYVPSRTLRSFSFDNFYVPHTNLYFGSRWFHTAAPTVWKLSPFHSSFVSNLKHFPKTF